MRILQLSSGDPIADGRAAHAGAYAEGGDMAVAADLMEQALELAPRWAAGWSLLGDYRLAAGDEAGAIDAWRALAGLDTNGLFGATLKLAAHGAGAPEPDPAYVEALFDDYADRFETSLVERLDYRTPRELADLLQPHIAGARPSLALDLGCGTGLMGVELRPLVERLVGIDLSAAMLGKARGKQIYDELVQGELLAYLAQAHAGMADLAVASDVLNYTGALEPVLAALRRVLRRGGHFAFSLELHEGEEALVLRETLRFAHREDAALAACAATGFAVEAARRTVLRSDRGQPVAGLIVVARAG